MNPKIVVDHELFTTCRLCLEEKGRYQIVPAIQENIKFVFDIEVELNNGLPQLICVECEKLLSNFVCTKQLFQEKQKRLQKKFLCTTESPEGSGTEETNSHQHNRLSLHSIEECSETEHERVVVSSCGENNKLIIKKSKKTQNNWRSSFVKQFGCRLCSEKFKKKDEIESHIRTHRRTVNNTCFVRLQKIDEKPNVTGSTKFVALNNNKIMRNKKKYYIVYSHKSIYESDSSEDDVLLPKRKYKRPKLDSESSVDTLLIGESETDIKTESQMIESNPPKLEIEDCTNSSTSECNTRSIHSDNGQSGNVIDTLITVCYNNLLKKMANTNIGSKNAADKSQLQHKILSIGSKIINTNPINCIGILRYLEYGNLEVNFITKKSKDDNYVRIRTKLKCKKEKHDDKIKINSWKSLQNTSISEPKLDFFEVLNKAESTDTADEDHTSQTTSPASGILLNANPVPNPKKLPKKKDESNSTQKSLKSPSTSRENDINKTNQTILSTMLSKETEKDTAADGSASKQNSLPRLKLKPVHELMASQRPDNNNLYVQPFNCYANSAQNSTTAAATAAPQMYAYNYNARSNGHNAQKFINIAPKPAPIQPLSQIGNTMSIGQTGAIIQKPEYVVLHTVEFPNTTTSSPFIYFRNLLQVNNIALLDSKATLTTDFRCLIKFKLIYERGGLHIELCLSLFSNVECFCIKIENQHGVDISINEMSAYWQWEVLKYFANEIVQRLVNNARTISLPMYDSVQKFVWYLKSIQRIDI